MKFQNLFSKRNKPSNEEIDSLFDINHFPKKMKIQVIHILQDFFNQRSRLDGGTGEHNFYSKIVQIMNHEYGINLFSGDQLLSTFASTNDIYFLYDFIELAFSEIESFRIKKHKKQKGENDRENYRMMLANALSSDMNTPINESIEELNTRFKENGIGFRYEKGKILRIDSDYTHEEITTPVLNLLQQKVYEGTNDEFNSAYQHYKYGRNKECINDCLKAFESTLKAICDKRKWKYDKQRDTAKKLVDICFAHKLIPDYLKDEINNLKSLLTSGVPTIRNRESGHGQGKKIKMVDDYIAGYALNLTASNILLLINSERFYKTM